jgi:hypothetical protein
MHSRIVRLACCLLTVILFMSWQPALAQVHESVRVAGQVVDAQGKPVAKATVYWCIQEAFEGRRDLTVQASSDAAGNFHSEAPRESGLTSDSLQAGRLWVYAEGHALEVVDAAQILVSMRSGKTHSITLSPVAPFKLCVVDPDEQTRPGELVEPTHFDVGNRRSGMFPWSLRDRLAAITDGNGHYAVSYVKHGARLRLRVVSEKYGIQEEHGLTMRGDVPVVTFPLLPTARLEGITVGEDPKAFAGIRITLLTYTDSIAANNRVTQITSRVSAVVGDDGRFEVPAIAAGELLVNLPGPVRLSSPVVSAPRMLEPGSTATIKLSPEPTTIFRGKVITEGTGEPVPKAEVTISCGRRRVPQITLTDENGEFRIKSFAIKSELRAISPGGIVQCRTPVEVEVAVGSKEVLCPPVKLPPIRTISGVLVNTNGQPVANATVIGLEVAIHHGEGTTSEKGQFQMVTAAERTITDYIVKVNGESRAVTIESRDPLRLKLDK